MLGNYRFLGLTEILNSTKTFTTYYLLTTEIMYKHFFSVAQEFKSGLDHLIVEISNSHEIRHPPSKNSLNEWSARSRACYIHNT